MLACPLFSCANPLSVPTALLGLLQTWDMKHCWLYSNVARAVKSEPWYMRCNSCSYFIIIKTCVLKVTCLPFFLSLTHGDSSRDKLWINWPYKWLQNALVWIFIIPWWMDVTSCLSWGILAPALSHAVFPGRQPWDCYCLNFYHQVNLSRKAVLFFNIANDTQLHLPDCRWFKLESLMVSRVPSIVWLATEKLHLLPKSDCRVRPDLDFCR